MHKSHSGMYQIDRSDYDAQGNKIAGRSRDAAGMNAEIDYINTYTDKNGVKIIIGGHLHRKWYHQAPIDVVSKICKREQRAKERVEFYNSGFMGTIAEYVSAPSDFINKYVTENVFVPFDWAKPKKLDS